MEIKDIIQEFAKYGNEKEIQSHTILISPNKKVHNIYWVIKGGLVLSHVHPATGEEKAINFFTPRFHPIATVAEAFYLNEPSKFYLKTFTNTTLIEVSKENFEHLYKNSDYSDWLQQYSIKSLIEKNELRAMLIALDSKEMLGYIRKKYPQILQDVPSKYIANILNITPQWLSKLKHLV